MKFKLTEAAWNKPTPAVWRRIGETTLILCGVVAGSVYMENPTVAAIVFVAGLIGRGLVEFFIAE